MVERSQRGDDIIIRVVESRRGTHVAGYAIKSRQIHPPYEVLTEVLIEVLMRYSLYHVSHLVRWGRVQEGLREKMT